jgi:multisubunit Na+/H+ antiporter MnhB subunit
MTYSRDMAIRIALFGIPAVAVVGLIFLMNGLKASPGIAFAAFTVVAVATGAAIGCFADRLPGAQQSRRAHTASRRHGR